MVATAVNKSNLHSEAWNNVYALLSDPTQFSDPKGTTVAKRKWVYSRRPDVKAQEFKGYPYLVVHPAYLSRPSNVRTLSGQKQMYAFNIQVDIITSDRADDDGKGATQLDSIANNLVLFFNSQSIRATLRANGLPLADATSTPAGNEDEHKSLVYTRTVLLMFTSMKKVF